MLDIFYKKVSTAILNKDYLPIIRIADGEYQFLLGKNEFNTRKPLLFLIKNLLGELYRKLIGAKFEAKSRTYTSGVYSNKDIKYVKQKYSMCLKHISKNGFIALYTIIKPNFYTEQYLPKLYKFFKKNDIELSTENYVPFYFIYIILTNRKYSEIYKNRNIHLITNFNSEKKFKIEKSLYELGAKSISWSLISRDKSLFDKIDLNSIEEDVEIIFVGAGVGKVNIFNQLINIKALIIDAGYIFETWQDPSLRLERDYCNEHGKSVTTNDS